MLMVFLNAPDGFMNLVQHAGLPDQLKPITRCEALTLGVFAASALGILAAAIAFVTHLDLSIVLAWPNPALARPRPLF